MFKTAKPCNVEHPDYKTVHCDRPVKHPDDHRGTDYNGKLITWK